ncbi:hypothetical protein N9K05_04820 [Woeseiaceae bacterium]|nr:hypothetical protein [Woeseiaceae bacterium]
MKKIIKFGVLVDSFELKKWQTDCLKLLSSHEQIACGLVIIKKQTKPKAKILSWLSFDKYRYFLYLLYQKLMNTPKSWYPENLKELGLSYKIIECDLIGAGVSSELSREDICNIKSFELDFLIRFGFGILKGDILNAAKHGIWSFHHDDEEKYRGRPPCFWPIYFKNNLSGVILQKLNETLDGGVILEKGIYKTLAHSYSKNIDNIYQKSIYFPLIVCQRLLLNAIDIDSLKPVKNLGSIYKIPTNIQMLFFIYRVTIGYLNYLYKAIFRTQFWHIGIIKKPIWHVLDNDTLNIEWLPAYKKNRFLADPFGLIINGNLNIFAEEYKYSLAKGEIVSFDYLEYLENQNSKKIFDEIYHLSYPFVFKYNNSIYCIPESSRSNQVTLYKIDKTLLKWEKYKLIDNISVLDPTIFQYSNKWWLMCSDRKYGSSSLSLWFADDLMGPWSEHHLNPIRNDVRYSRSGGTIFEYNNKLYRPSQNNECSYGGELNLFEIVNLTESSYEEVYIRAIRPDNKSEFPSGIHTLSSVGDYTLVDGRRDIFNISSLWLLIKNKLKRWIG